MSRDDSLAGELVDELIGRRERLGLSLAEVAGRCGLDAQMLEAWEGGAGGPSLDQLQRWAAALGAKLTLLGGGDAPARQGVRIDWEAKRLTVHGQPVRLTPMEWRALELLARTPGRLVPHQELYRHLYGADRQDRAQSTAVRVLITKLRRLLPLPIEARWGQGYVIGGVDAPPPEPECRGADAQAEPCPEPPAKPQPPARPAFAARPAAALGAALIEFGKRPRPTPPSQRRIEELGVIERYLAERGATRCPDVATIQKSPLPTLVWDKIKRKWVRPPAVGYACRPLSGAARSQP